MGGWLDLEAENAYDLLAAINGPFAHLVTGAERADALARSYSSLRPGGVLSLDLPNLLWVLHDYRGPSDQTRGLEDGRAVRLFRHHEIDYDRAVFRTIDDYTLTHPDGRTETLKRLHDYAITSAAELRHLLAEAGFVEVQTYNTYEARAPEPLRERGRMMITARKSLRA